MSRHTHPTPIRTTALEKLRNIGIVAHIDAGKTTCTERILFDAGVQHTCGDVHSGNTTTDYDAEEKKRGITIKAAAVSMVWRGHAINLIDTPGHIDFTAEVQRSLRVLDGAIVVFSGVEGVQAQSETVWRQAERFGVPRICFVNKLDRVGADFEKVVEQIRTRLGVVALALHFPVGREDGMRGMIDLVEMRHVLFVAETAGSRMEVGEIPAEELAAAKDARAWLVQAVADLDEGIGEMFLREVAPNAEQLRAAIRRLCVSRRAVPVLCGSAYKHVGVQPLLDAVVDYLPSPLEAQPIAGTDPDDAAAIVERLPSVNEPLAALAFKTLHDDFGELTFVRIYSGTIRKGERVFNSRRGKVEKMDRLYRIHANQSTPLDAAGAGEIIAIGGMRHTVTGDTLCREDAPILLEPPAFPDAVISMAIEPRSNDEKDKLGLALSRLMREDPTFVSSYDAETGQTLIAGMGELHLETIRNKLVREYKLDVRVGTPRVAYRETVTRAVEIEERYIAQRGGPGLYAVCWLRIEPFLNDETDFVVFESAVKNGAIPIEYIPSVEKGVRSAARSGVLNRGRLIHVKVTLLDGAFHEKDSSTLAFELCGAAALRSAALAAGPVLLEPIMSIEVVTPLESMGAILGDLQARRAEIVDVADQGHLKAIRATAPLSELFSYANASRALSSGRATFSMEPCGYKKESQKAEVRRQK